jgi:putative transposase
MCRLAGVSRAGFYRRFLKREPRTEEVELRSEMQRIVLAHRHRYGYRRVTAALRAEGWAVNRKRIARLMRDALGARLPDAGGLRTGSDGSAGLSAGRDLEFP